LPGNNQDTLTQTDRLYKGGEACHADDQMSSVHAAQGDMKILRRRVSAYPITHWMWMADCELRKTVANLRHPRWGPA